MHGVLHLKIKAPFLPIFVMIVAAVHLCTLGKEG
jgi:hypothetical protein